MLGSKESFCDRNLEVKTSTKFIYGQCQNNIFSLKVQLLFLCDPNTIVFYFETFDSHVGYDARFKKRNITLYYDSRPIGYYSVQPRVNSNSGHPALFVSLRQF